MIFHKLTHTLLFAAIALAGLLGWWCRQVWIGSDRDQTRFVPGVGRSGAAMPAASGRAEPDQAAKARVVESLGKLPLAFEANRGQVAEPVKFAARGPGYQVFLTSDEVVLSLKATAHGLTARSAVVRMKLKGATAHPQITGIDELPGKVNYFEGRDASRWRAGIPAYARVKYQGVYPGVDVIYYGNQRRLEYDFVVAPGADPRVIRLVFDGVRQARATREGDLALATGGAELRQRKPIAYQEVAGERREVASRYVIEGEREVGMEVGDYDRSQPLVIDPMLVYSTYLGGSFADETISGIAVDAAGNAYVTGYSESFDFPGVPVVNGNRSVYRSVNGAGTWNPTGNAGLPSSSVTDLLINPANPATIFAGVRANDTVYKSTNGGGNWTPSASGLPSFGVERLAIDPVNPSTIYAGTLYSGVYKSTNGGGAWNPVNTGLPAGAGVSDIVLSPVTPGTLYAAINGSVYKSVNSGDNWSLSDTGLPATSIARLAVDPVDVNGTLYAATQSGVYKSTNGGGTWSLSNAGITGAPYLLAISPATPTTLFAVTADGVFKSADGGMAWSPSGTGLPGNFIADLVVDPANPATLYVGTEGGGVYKSSNGGSNWFSGSSGVLSGDIRTLAIDPVNPATLYAGAFGDYFVFVAKLNAAGSALAYSTYIHGSSFDIGRDIAVDSAGNAYLTGNTNSSDFPITPGAYLANGSVNPFLTRLNAAGGISYSTFLPAGKDFSVATAVAVDGSGRVYVTGFTHSSDFPTTPGAFQTAFGGGSCLGSLCADGFLMQFNPVGGGASDLLYSTFLGGNSNDYPDDLAVDSPGRIYVTGQTYAANFPTTPGALQPAFGGGTCSGISCSDAFVSKLNPAGAGPADLEYSTYLGGNEEDFGGGIAVDSMGRIYVTGSAASSNFPTTPGAYQPAPGGGTCDGTCSDAFVAKINPAAAGAAGLLYSTYLGGGGFDYGLSIALDSAANVYVAGSTRSFNFPTLGSLQTLEGGSDGFVAKLNLNLPGAAALIYSTLLGGNDYDHIVGVAADPAGNAYVAGVTSSPDFPTVNPFQTNQPFDDGFMAKFCDLPDLALTLSANSTLTLGATGVYSIVARNESGACPAPNPITITDTLPGNLTLQSFSGAGWNCAGLGGANVSCTHPGPLAPAASLPTLQLTVNVGAGTPLGTNSIANTVTVSTPGDMNAANNTATIQQSVFCPAITLNPAELPSALAGVFYNQMLTASGGVAPYSFSVTAGALPANVTLSASGGLSGTPPAVGAFNFTVKATDQSGCMSAQNYTLAVCTAISVNPPALPNGFVGVAYNQSFTQTGGAGAATWSVSAGALPGGLSLGATTGVLSGTPSAQGSFSFTVRATDANNCFGERSYTIIISGASLVYYPLPRPIRLFDTRAPIPGFAACAYLNQPLLAGQELARPAAGVTCDGITIPANAQAIVGNATVTGAFGDGFITLFPDGQPRPPVSNLNYVAGQTVPNAFTVGLSGNGMFRTFSTSTTHFIVDVTGYFAPPGAGGLYYHPLPRPIRLFDTRAPIPGFAACAYLNQPLVADGEIVRQARITCDGITIPADATAIVGNATVTGATGNGFITLFPNGQPRPPVSNLNYTTGQTVPNAFTVGLGSDGQFRVYSVAGTHFIVDVTGYYSSSAADVNGTGLLYNPLARPIRLFDTRAPIPGFAACEYLNQPLLADAELAKQARITCDGITIPAAAQAIVGNATVVSAFGSGFVTLWPNGQPRPPVSNLNYTAGQVVPNAFTVGLGGDGQFRIYSLAGTHFIVDLTGHFAP